MTTSHAVSRRDQTPLRSSSCGLSVDRKIDERERRADDDRDRVGDRDDDGRVAHEARCYDTPRQAQTGVSPRRRCGIPAVFRAAAPMHLAAREHDPSHAHDPRRDRRLPGGDAALDAAIALAAETATRSSRSRSGGRCRATTASRTRRRPSSTICSNAEREHAEARSTTPQPEPRPPGADPDAPRDR